MRIFCVCAVCSNETRKQLHCIALRAKKRSWLLSVTKISIKSQRSADYINKGQQLQVCLQQLRVGICGHFQDWIYISIVRHPTP